MTSLNSGRIGCVDGLVYLIVQDRAGITFKQVNREIESSSYQYGEYGAKPAMADSGMSSMNLPPYKAVSLKSLHSGRNCLRRRILRYLLHGCHSQEHLQVA